MENISNSYADAMDTLLSDDEKVRLIEKLNATLPQHLQFASKGVATTPAAFLNAIENAFLQLSRAMLSSGFNPWVAGRITNNQEMNEKIRRLNNVATFHDFTALYNKLQEWSVEYEAAIKDLYEDNGS